MDFYTFLSKTTWAHARTYSKHFFRFLQSLFFIYVELDHYDDGNNNNDFGHVKL